ncbi:MAG: methionyl-tRNA formyltransferase [Rubrivivax sp.]
MADRFRVGFAGTPAFAQAALAALADAGHDIPLVLTQPDRPAGRGLKLQASAVKQEALARGLPVIQPRSLRLDGKYPDDAAAAQAALAVAGLDVLVVAAYGLILPAWTLASARRGCVNIHGSLLPRWRGAAPIQRAIEAGDAETGITLMQMDAGLDTGPMIAAEAVPIGPDDNASTLHDRLAALGARLVVDALPAWVSGELAAHAQPADGVTYAHKIDKAEAAIDWSQPAAVIERRVRAFDPFPGCSFQLDGETVKLWRAAPVPGEGEPGQCLPAPPGVVRVACGDGALDLLTLQRTGGRRIAAADFLRGRGVTALTRLA